MNSPGTGQTVPASDWLHECINLNVYAKCSQILSDFKYKGGKLAIFNAIPICRNTLNLLVYPS